MKKLLVIIGAVFALVLGLVAWWASQPKEPVYEGRPLSSWLYHHVASSAAIPPYGSPGWRKAEEAIEAIGTNGIPTLVRMIRAKDPPAFVLKPFVTVGRSRWIRFDYRYAYSRNEEAEYAFEKLGPKAAAAVPELIRIYQENRSPSSQRCAALALGHIGKPAGAAVPVLIRDFPHTNKEVRFYAVSAVMHIGGEPDLVLPALTGALKDSSVDVRWNALVGISMYGSRARPVVPEVLKMLEDKGAVGDTPIRKQVEVTLWRIAPEKAGPTLVVEPATPMITNGVTAAPIKVRFKGQMRTLISAGKRVPTLAQFWDSDPRPQLTLCRGTDAGVDQLLGTFEVLDLPEAENLNVSTLCVVADGTIFLCARDNTNEGFVRIRKIE